MRMSILGALSKSHLSLQETPDDGGRTMSTGRCDVCGTPMPVVRKPANLRQALWGGWTCPNCHSEFDRWGRNLGLASLPRTTRTLDNVSYASSPGGIVLSDDRLRRLRPDLYGLGQRLGELVGLAFPQRTYLREHLQNGDSRAAVVVSVDPLLVAAYSDELDCVALLRFPGEFVADYKPEIGTRLLTVNTYRRGTEVDTDLAPGPRDRGSWSGFHPVIADFVSDDEPTIDARKDAITEDEWERTYKLGCRYLHDHPGKARDGRPVFAGAPAGGDRGRADDI